MSLINDNAALIQMNASAVRKPLRKSVGFREQKFGNEKRKKRQIPNVLSSGSAAERVYLVVLYDKISKFEILSSKCCRKIVLGLQYSFTLRH